MYIISVENIPWAFFERRWPHSHVHPGSESFEKICDAWKKPSFSSGGFQAKSTIQTVKSL